MKIAANLNLKAHQFFLLTAGLYRDGLCIVSRHQLNILNLSLLLFTVKLTLCCCINLKPGADI